MYEVETATRIPKGLQRCSDVLLDLGCLTREAGSGPNPHLFVEPVPHKLETMSLLEVCIEGWDKQWMTSKTCLLHPSGTTGLGWPVDVSQRMVLPLLPNGTSSSWRPGQIGQCGMLVYWGPLFGWQRLLENYPRLDGFDSSLGECICHLIVFVLSVSNISSEFGNVR